MVDKAATDPSSQDPAQEQIIKDPCILPKEWNIWQRINWVRSEEYYVKKDAAVQGYMGVTHDAVTAAIHDKLVQAGIIIYPDLKESHISDAGTTSKGTPIIRYEGTYIVSFVNTVRPEDFIKLTVEAHANDQGDKAPGKCCSYAQKTAILKMFAMETGVNDEGRIDARIAETEGQKPITDSQVKELEDLIQFNELDREKVMQWIARSLKVETISELNQTGYTATKGTIEAAIKRKANETA